jgi:uncharacterized RDD family membrane protein YckC
LSKPERAAVRREILDTVVASETPEGILLELRPTGLSARYYAFIVDWIIRFALIDAAAMIAPFFGGIGLAVWIILIFALEWLYPVVFELGAAAATPGKRIFGLKVVMDNGLPITAAASMTRNLLRVADFLPFAFGFGVLSMLTRSDHKRLGDLAAGTLVVHSPRRDARGDIEQRTPVMPALPLAAEDQAALVALAARAPRLTRARLDELAALAAAVSGNAGQSGPAVTKRVLGVAQWVLGRR